jgi:1-aminocyclopropane-1-carboxylate deaminase/D-cysteine desulfhydrase-like pyridoxal-dependent ACC family enzyme
MTSQPHTEHAERTFRAALGAGLEVLPLPSATSISEVLRRAVRRSDYWIGPGAMGALGGIGYVTAAAELWQQVEGGQIPAPTRIVIAVGSGSSAAGLLVGLACTPLRSQIVGVLAAKSPAARSMILAQATLVARKIGSPLLPREWSERLKLRSDAVGGGYGVPSAAAERTTKIAAYVGLKLDPTYTSKACTVACELARTDTEPTLYWHTLSSAPLEPLLASAPTLSQLPARLRDLLRPNTLGDHPKPAGSE